MPQLRPVSGLGWTDESTVDRVPVVGRELGRAAQQLPGGVIVQGHLTILFHVSARIETLHEG
jgi:hypothetical protein